jgi:hypothetical protein
MSEFNNYRSHYHQKFRTHTAIQNNPQLVDISETVERSSKV